MLLAAASLAACTTTGTDGMNGAETILKRIRAQRSALVKQAVERRQFDPDPQIAYLAQSAASPEASLEQYLLDQAKSRDDGSLDSAAVAARALLRDANLEAAAQVEGEVKAFKKWQGWNWSVGPSITFGGKKEIQEAKVVKKGDKSFLRVTDEASSQAGIMLETHYFFHPSGEGFNEKGNWGIGPFVAVQLDQEDGLDGVGHGLMTGWRYDDNKANSFNIGFGPFLDNEVQRLPRGFRDGEELPEGESSVDYRKVDDWKWMLTVSFTWSF